MSRNQFNESSMGSKSHKEKRAEVIRKIRDIKKKLRAE